MTPHRILVVDDEEPLREALKQKCIEAGHQVIEAADGEQALQIALAEHPDAILLDVVMPKMNGLDVLKQLRQDDWGKDVPVLILTNLNDYSTVAEAMSQNTFDILVKSDETLEDVVKQLGERLTTKRPAHTN